MRKVAIQVDGEISPAFEFETNLSDFQVASTFEEWAKGEQEVSFLSYLVCKYEGAEVVNIK